VKAKTRVKAGSMTGASTNPLYTDKGLSGNNPLYSEKS
jgi:hypothetical protein